MASEAKGSIISAVDYIVFAVIILMSASTGFFYAWKDRKERNMDNFHRGKRKANPVAVALSLSVTIISAITVLSLASEVYTYGTMIAWQISGILIATVFSAYVLLPVFYNMNTISVFQYIQMRFGNIVRLVSTVIFLFMNLLVMGFALYAPCLAFQAMSGVSLWIIMVAAAFVGTIYTWLGGMKAVVWADSLQFVIIIAGLMCTLIKGSLAVGGFERAWEIAGDHNRIELLNVSFDPRTRHTVWGFLVGYFVSWAFAFGANQSTVQRACSLPTLKIAQRVELVSFIGLLIIFFLTLLNGVIIFAYYHTCDPVSDGRITRNDQLFPLLIVDLLGNLPGLPGLLLACLFSAALSSISSGLNAMSAVLIEDFVKRYVKTPLSENKQVFLSKVFILVIGAFIFGFASIISQLSGLMHQLMHTLVGVLGGPMEGLFFSGLFFPWVNAYGAFAGLIGSIGLSSWLIFGSLVNTSAAPPLPVSVSECSLTNSSNNYYSTTTTSTLSYQTTEAPALLEFYRMSYLWYAAYGTGSCIIISLIVSFLTKPNDPKEVDSRLISPLFYNLCPFLPEKYRKYLLFGVDYSKDVEKREPAANKVQSVYSLDRKTSTDKPEKINLSFGTKL